MGSRPNQDTANSADSPQRFAFSATQTSCVCLCLREIRVKVFLAGASGAIGRPLVAELIRQGHQVTGISRRASSLNHLTKLGATIVEVDVFDAAALERALRDSEAEAVID